MTQSLLDLRIFSPRYRQALLYSMIEGLMEGSKITIIYNGNVESLKNELLIGFEDYRLAFQQLENDLLQVMIVRNAVTESAGNKSS